MVNKYYVYCEEAYGPTGDTEETKEEVSDIVEAYCAESAAEGWVSDFDSESAYEWGIAQGDHDMIVEVCEVGCSKWETFAVCGEFVPAYYVREL